MPRVTPSAWIRRKVDKVLPYRDEKSQDEQSEQSQAKKRRRRFFGRVSVETPQQDQQAVDASASTTAVPNQLSNEHSDRAKTPEPTYQSINALAFPSAHQSNLDAMPSSPPPVHLGGAVDSSPVLPTSSLHERPASVNSHPSLAGLSDGRSSPAGSHYSMNSKASSTIRPPSAEMTKYEVAQSKAMEDPDRLAINFNRYLRWFFGYIQEDKEVAFKNENNATARKMIYSELTRIHEILTILEEEGYRVFKHDLDIRSNLEDGYEYFFTRWARNDMYWRHVQAMGRRMGPIPFR